jgi:DNA-binding CsgD family transcriptional regulator
MDGKSPSPREPRWRLLYEMVEDLSRQRSCQGALDTVLKDACDLVPADRGLSLIRMEGRIPYCLRWPDYADSLVPLFNSTLNRRSPFYYQPPYTVLPAVDWFDYRESEYHREFNVPLGIRYSLGVGFRDFSADTQYVLFVHRSTRDSSFDDEDIAAMGSMREAVSNLLTLIGSTYGEWERRIRERECRSGCDVLSAREREVAQLICRRLTMNAIAARLGISARTVERHALHIYQKLALPGRRELIQLCGRADGEERPGPGA